MALFRTPDAERGRMETFITVSVTAALQENMVESYHGNKKVSNAGTCFGVSWNLVVNIASDP